MDFSAPESKAIHFPPAFSLHDKVITSQKLQLWKQKSIIPPKKYIAAIQAKLAHMKKLVQHSLHVFTIIFAFFQTTNCCLFLHIERLDGYKAFQKHKVYMTMNHTGISGFSLLLEVAWKPLMEVCFQNPSLEHINANPPHTCITGSINGFAECGGDKIGCRQREERVRHVKRLSFHLYLHLIISSVV